MDKGEKLIDDYGGAVWRWAKETDPGAIDEAIKFRKETRAYVKALEDERMEAINLLKQIEWIKDEWANYCPACNRPQYEGHQIDCVLLKLIKEREK